MLALRYEWQHGLMLLSAEFSVLFASVREPFDIRKWFVDSTCRVL